MGRTKRQQNLHQSSNVKFQYAFEKKKLSNNCIENFSNEIFYEIFDYLDGYDVYQAFSNLNNRFTYLLNSSSFLMKIEVPTTIVFDSRYERFLNSNKHHILSFHFSNQLIVGQFISSYIINSSFHHLESLVLDQISTMKLLVLLFHLKSLPRFFSLTVCPYDCYEDLGDIYQVIFSLPVLKYLKLEISEYQEADIIIPIATDGHFSSMEYLVIDPCCTLNEVTDLLSYTPQLSRLSCVNLVEAQEPINAAVLKKLTHLVQLNVTINDIHFDEFEGFLSKLCSQLKFLSVKIQCVDRNYIDGDRWERLISQKMPLLTKFIFSYADWIYDDFETKPHHSLINRFTSPFWIERRWILRLSVVNDEILYTIRPYEEMPQDFEEHIDIPVVNNSSLHLLSGAQMDLKNSFFLDQKSQLFVNKINSLFKTIEITRLDVQYNKIPVDLFIEILNFLPNLDLIRLSHLPSYEDIYDCDPDIDAINLFLKNNKITKLTLKNISDLEQINLIIDLFPRLQYFGMRRMNNIDLESTVRCTLLKIKENKIFHPTMLCFFDADAEYDKVQKLKQMIDSEDLLKDYTINRRLNRFYLQWK